MTKRLITKETYGEKVAKVYKDLEWGEYIVKFYASGVHMDNSDYVTDDRSDAVNTAYFAVRDGSEWCEANNLAG